MCGIAGIFGLEGINNPAQVAHEMVQRLAHRGPDASGTKAAGNCILGHTRLSIIDLSTGANQPFQSTDGRYTLVFNGEIYNYQSLKSELSHYSFKTHSDTEVLLAALITWGAAALQRLNGMFAFAFWDREKEQLIIARDRAGIKPLYYAFVGQSLLFASEIRSLLASGLIAKKLNQAALIDYLRYQCVHAPSTLVEHVKMLMPGCYMQLNDNEVNTVEYWKPWQSEHRDRDLPVVMKHVREKLTTAIERRMVADVPFGAFLSGGIDSSLVVGIISKTLGLTIDTFNVSFDESQFSESVYAQKMAKTFRTNHHEIRLKPKNLLESLPQALDDMDHPSGDGPNTWIVSRETKKQGITMALSGLGGDELFAGYDVFRRIPYISERDWILSFPKFMRGMVGNALLAYKPNAQNAKTREILLADYFDLEHLYPIFRQVLLDKDIAKLTGKRLLTANRVQSIVKELSAFHGFENLPTLSRISIAEMHTYMQNVLLRDTDQMSMAHALEVRVPFLDHELIEYCMHIPDNLKYPLTPKKLLVDSFREMLPDEIVNRPKMGFVLPWEHWMKRELKSFCESHIAFLAGSSHLSEQQTNHLWNRFLVGDSQYTWSRVWPLVTLSHWMQKNGIE